jgi:hypothetical protein
MHPPCDFGSIVFLILYSEIQIVMYKVNEVLKVG